MTVREASLKYPLQTAPPLRCCLSCGTTENMRRRKYCSMACRQRLHRRLDQRTGLLQAINARYATFHFTTRIVVMDVVVGFSPVVYSFLFPRRPGQVPADDFGCLADHLGRLWWAEQRRTRKRYLASRLVLDGALQRSVPRRQVAAPSFRLASVRQDLLIQLAIDRASLDGPDPEGSIKRAFRRQAHRCHPDLGGDGASFRRLRAAYEELLVWAESPTFIQRRGFPDRWFYDGARNGWVQPVRVVSR